MLSKTRSAVEILRNKGFYSLLKESKQYLFHSRDRLREIDGPAVDIYDCFIFYNEFELLELRLNELDDIVDYFVIIEATETFQGETKPPYFEQRKEEFSEFEDKIIHHIVDFPDELTDPWEREHYHRDSIQSALKQDTNIKHQDKIIISDTDEIPNPDSIRKAVSRNGLCIFSLKRYNYYYNMERCGEYREGGAIMSDYIDFTSGQDFRNRNLGAYDSSASQKLLELRLTLRNRRRTHLISEGGWHFSWIGDEDFIINKIESFAHSEFNEEKYKNEDRIRKVMEEGGDLFDLNRENEIVSLDKTFPNYLIDNKEKFSNNILND